MRGADTHKLGDKLCAALERQLVHLGLVLVGRFGCHGCWLRHKKAERLVVVVLSKLSPLCLLFSGLLCKLSGVAAVGRMGLTHRPPVNPGHCCHPTPDRLVMTPEMRERELDVSYGTDAHAVHSR